MQMLVEALRDAGRAMAQAFRDLSRAVSCYGWMLSLCPKFRRQSLLAYDMQSRNSGNYPPDYANGELLLREKAKSSSESFASGPNRAAPAQLTTASNGAMA